MPTDLMARMLRNTSTADLYGLVAAALTELTQRSDVDGHGPARLDLTEGRIDTEYAEIRYENDTARYMAVFYEEGSASLACEETRAPAPGSTWPPAA